MNDLLHAKIAQDARPRRDPEARTAMAMSKGGGDPTPLDTLGEGFREGERDIQKNPKRYLRIYNWNAYWKLFRKHAESPSKEGWRIRLLYH